jgi:hypothetical protein
LTSFQRYLIGSYPNGIEVHWFHIKSFLHLLPVDVWVMPFITASHMAH